MTAMPTRRSFGLAGLAFALVAALAWGFWPRPVLVETGTVSRGPLVVTVEEEGRTRVRDRFELSVPVPGHVRRLSLLAGDTVAEGQAVAELEPLRSTVLDPRSRAEAEARVALAESALHAAEHKAAAATAEAGRARGEHERRKRLCETGCISKEELENAAMLARRTEAEQRSAEFGIQVARFELEAARTALGYSAAQGAAAPAERVTLRSPVAGRVLKVLRRSEGPVQAGEILLEVGDPHALEVEVDVLSSEAVRIPPGGRVRLDRWGGDGLLDAVVRTVEPSGFTKVSALGVEEQRVWVIADLTSPSDQWARLGDGYRVEAAFVIWEESDVLQVPVSALFRRNEGWAAFVVRDGAARLQPVRLGHRNAHAAEVLEGVSAGDTVVLHPSNAVREGIRVKAR
jgi:HlyD family secretion protein